LGTRGGGRRGRLDDRVNERFFFPTPYYLWKKRLLSAWKRLRNSHNNEIKNTTFITPSSRRSILFCYEQRCPSQLYRCVHAGTVLENLGYKAEFASLKDISGLSDFLFLDNYCFLHLHRIPWNPWIARLVKAAKRKGIPVILDFDDHIFDFDVYRQSGIFEQLNRVEIAMHKNMVKRLQKTLSFCDFTTVSTPELHASLQAKNITSFIVPNAVSDDMIQRFGDTSDTGGTEDDFILGYLSGTTTHDRDFNAIVPALNAFLEQHQGSRLLVAGPLKLETSFENRFRSRIIRHELVPWVEIPSLYNKIDINLAPLESDNEFCRAKSPIKFFEAGLAQKPTIASPIPAFIQVIKSGSNGFLAETPEEWHKILNNLFSDGNLCKRIGQNAHNDVINRFHLTKTVPIWECILDKWIDSK